jgi:YfiH family protein
VTDDDAGAGGWPTSERPPLTGVDALVTAAPGIPLLLFFADCVPVVLVAPGPAVAVVHAGWRGALGGVAANAATELATVAGCDASELLGYIGPHIGACHYPVDETILSQFANTFGTVARAKSGGLDLDSAVRSSLTDAGVSQWRITSLGACTAEETERFFSYRAESGMTGRHGALACVLPCSG